MNKLKWIILLLLGLILLIGCGKNKEQYTIEDVNGIPKVLNSKQEIIPFKLESELTMGSNDDEIFFSRISQVCEDEKGNIYILDGGESTITIMDANGNFLRKIGGEGKGPGELIRPKNMIFTPNGNLLISDVGNYRFQILDSDGNYINSFILEEDIPGAACYDMKGNVINHNSSFSWGLSDPALFNVYDAEMKKSGKFGELLLNDDKNVQHLQNMGKMITNSLNQIIFVRELDNEYTIYEDKKILKRFNVDMNIEPTEVEVKVQTSGDNRGISIWRDPICLGLSIDSRDRIYSLIRNTDFDDDDETTSQNYFVIDVFDPTGIHLSRYGLGQNRYSEIYVGKDDKIYLVNQDEATVARFPAI